MSLLIKICDYITNIQHISSPTQNPKNTNKRSSWGTLIGQCIRMKIGWIILRCSHKFVVIFETKCEFPWCFVPLQRPCSPTWQLSVVYPPHRADRHAIRPDIPVELLCRQCDQLPGAQPSLWLWRQAAPASCEHLQKCREVWFKSLRSGEMQFLSRWMKIITLD